MTDGGRPSDTALYRRVFLEARPFWRHIGGLFVLSLLVMPLTILTPWPLKIVVDSILGNHELPGLLRQVLPAEARRTDIGVLVLVASLPIAIALGREILEQAFAILRSYTGEKLLLTFRAKLFRHTQGLSLTYHDKVGSADSAYRIQYDAPAVQWIAVEAFIPLVSSLLTLTAMIVIMARIDLSLALVALTVTPILYGASQIYSRRLKIHWREAKTIESSTLGVVHEALSAVRVVKAFAQEEREHARYVHHASRNLKEQIRIAVTGGWFSMIVGIAMAAGTAVVLFLAVSQVQNGRITLGDLVVVMSYLTMLYDPLQAVSRSVASLQGSLVSAARAFELLDQVPEVVEKPDARHLSRARGEVAFEGVSFSYTPDRPALCGISFEVPAGSRVGIEGTTGAGKSTLMSLMLRLYDPSEGRILLDGVDLRDLKVRDLRSQFAIVLQDPVLFSSSIGENIAYGSPDATPDEIVAAAQAANAHEFVSLLPMGYDTEVGERGVQLSGGERQRISLARAFLRNAPILILDEPTSSVDVKTEAAILQAVERLMQGRTTFMIAHRLTTLDICDMRIRIDRGEIASMSADAGATARFAGSEA
ncbi:MAG: ABC transporter ATP-binding protein [Gemmatimonadaceae bacterium]